MTDQAPDLRRGFDLAAVQGQDGFEVRLEWGPQGLRTLAPVVDMIVIVDVLSFTTSVTVAAEVGATVLPYKWRDDGEAEFARRHGAVLAGPPRRLDALSLSPTSIRDHGAGARIVLPSANGSALAFAARDEFAVDVVVAASLRNASAVARATSGAGTIGVVAAGERWRGATGPMRVALEDLLGAGAVIAAVGDGRSRSAEAAAAAAAFAEARSSLPERLAATASGRELAAKGFGADIALAGHHDASDVVPRLDGPAFTTA